MIKVILTKQERNLLYINTDENVAMNIVNAFNYVRKLNNMRSCLGMKMNAPNSICCRQNAKHESVKVRI